MMSCYVGWILFENCLLSRDVNDDLKRLFHIYDYHIIFRDGLGCWNCDRPGFNS